MGQQSFSTTTTTTTSCTSLHCTDRPLWSMRMASFIILSMLSLIETNLKLKDFFIFVKKSLFNFSFYQEQQICYHCFSEMCSIWGGVSNWRFKASKTKQKTKSFYCFLLLFDN